MRLLQLQFDGDGRDALDFHPMMTVVSGLDPAMRARLIAAVSALPRGADPGMGGLIESHGVLFELTVDNLGLLDLVGDLDPLIRAADLPGGNAPRGDAPAVAVAALTAEQFLASAAEGDHPELDAARLQQRSARETLSILREATERTRREHAEAAAALRRAKQAIDDATGTGASQPDDGAALLDDVLFDPPEEPRPVYTREELVAQIDELTARLAHVEQGLEELSALDTRPIEVLVDAIRNPAPGELVPSDRATQLADEFVSLQRQVDEFEASLEAQGRGTASALSALETARVELADAERAMAKPNLSPADVVELEAAHEAALDAESKSSGMFKRGGSKKLEEAMAAQQAVLDRVGFPTWSAYVMGAGLLGIDPVAEQRLEDARTGFAEAETHWAQVAADIEADPNHRALLDRLEAVYLEAFDLLGGDDEQADLEGALRAIRVPKGEVTQDELVDALAYQLELLGLNLGANPGIDRVLLTADAFLEEVTSISERMAELRVERDELQLELADARHGLDTLDAAQAAEAARVEPTIDLTDRADAVPVDDDDPSLDDLTRELEEALENESDYAEALEARNALVDASTRAEAVASSRVMRIAAELAAAAALRQPDPTEPPRPASDPAFDVDPGDETTGPEAIEFYLLARLAAQRSVSLAGSVPLLLDDALIDLDADVVRSLLDKLERMSEAVQIIYLSDDQRVTEWVASVGIQRAAVVFAPGHQLA